MNRETKDVIKKNVATGASTATGATAGVVIGAALSPEEAEAGEISSTEHSHHHPVDSDSNHTSKQESSNQEEVKPEAAKPEPTKAEAPSPEVSKPEANDAAITTQPETPADEVEVIGYDRITNEEGNSMEIAVINVNGNEVGVIDVNLDGQADAIVCDVNGNGMIDEGEIQSVEGAGIAMQPFADAAGYNPQFAQNDLPDYVNDADVDTYMA